MAFSFSECNTGAPTTNVESYSLTARLCILLWRRNDARQLSVWDPCNLSGKILILVLPLV